MELEYIILYNGCDSQKIPHRISLETKIIDYWAENKINANQISTEDISEVTVGPRTVFEYYESPHFTGQKNRVINASKDKIKQLNVGCLEDHFVFKGKVRSFIIWSYDYYMSLYGTRYCNDDSECQDREMCLCQFGQADPMWCRHTKKRCMASDKFLNEAPVPIRDNDYVDCNGLLKDLSTCKNAILFGELRKLSIKNMKRDPEEFDGSIGTYYEGFEGFQGVSEEQSNYMIITLIMIVILMFVIYLAKKK